MENNNNFFENRKVFPSITTTANSNWREKIKETAKLGLREVCLFLTCLSTNERKELYELLKETKIEKIPLVHLRNNMNSEELDYFVENYKTEVFNTHSERMYPLLYDIEKYKNVIYIENAILPLDEEEIENFAGICLDLSHLESRKLLNESLYKNDIKIIEKYPCGCNHISVIKKSPFKQKERLIHDSHHLEDLTELDYLKRYPAKYFSPILAIELENTIEEQLKAKDYLIDLLKDK